MLFLIGFIKFITTHIALGKVVGATPDGRKAGMPLAEGTGASHGCDDSCHRVCQRT